MDPLEDVLSHLAVRSHLSSTLVGGAAPWRLRFDAPTGLKFNAVLAGGAVLRTPETDGWLPVTAGDSYLLTRHDEFELASDDAVSVSRPASDVFAGAIDGVARVASEPADADPGFVALGGSFDFGRAAERLVDHLPPVLLVPGGSMDAAAVRDILVVIDQELRDRAPGATVVAEHLAVVLMVRTIRWHLAQGRPAGRSWLTGLVDPVVAPALSAIHAEPERPWTVAGLARASGVSRSTLAERFRAVTGTGPIEYLVDWRMELATERLQSTDASIAAIARSLGYGSESAFSNAFTRVRGVRPSRARRHAADTSAH